MATYESEVTQFMREWLAQHPEQIEVRKQGRALWWDKPQDVERMVDALLATVPPSLSQGAPPPATKH